jgi:hypothetical protein
MNINAKRYEEVVIEGLGGNPVTFLQKLHYKWWNKYYHKWSNKGENIAHWLEWKKKHPFKFKWMNLFKNIELWLICGFKIKYNKKNKCWVYSKHYHLLDKLCRYETAKNHRITWWDKIRFRIVTGYKFVKE